jgi:hypothetical protein
MPGAKAMKAARCILIPLEGQRRVELQPPLPLPRDPCELHRNAPATASRRDSTEDTAMADLLARSEAMIAPILEPFEIQ